MPRTRRAIVAAWLLSVAAPSPSLGQSAIFQSPNDDGARPEAPLKVPIGGSAPLELYIDLGPQPSTSDPCHLGDGNEVCAWDAEVVATRDLTLTSFTPVGDVVFNLTSGSLLANGGDPINGEIGPIKIGTLVASADGEEGTVELRGKHVVDARLTLLDVEPAVLAVTNDNCPNVLNAGQGDADGNGIGDLCQCGDVDGNGLTNTADALKIVRGQVLSSEPNFGKCDVNGDGFCNVTDALAIARGEVGSTPEAQLCPAYGRPVD